MRKQKEEKVKGNARLLYLTEKGSYEQSNLLVKCGVQSESRHSPCFSATVVTAPQAATSYAPTGPPYAFQT